MDQNGNGKRGGTQLALDFEWNSKAQKLDIHCYRNQKRLAGRRSDTKLALNDNGDVCIVTGIIHLRHLLLPQPPHGPTPELYKPVAIQFSPILPFPPPTITFLPSLSQLRHTSTSQHYDEPSDLEKVSPMRRLRLEKAITFVTPFGGDMTSTISPRHSHNRNLEGSFNAGRERCYQ
ncbi:hypothetical protein PM082_004957 [Marasmius tenuissimus]|nr:hypothetical protein PM082_004957 [Marasmius tenuissimus]